MKISNILFPISNERRVKMRGGFTLIELLVAIALFSIVVAVAAGGFVRALRTQRQLVALIAANSNASLALEEMARELRTSYDFECAEVGTFCEALSFTNADNEEVVYRRNEGTLEREVGGQAEPITADNVDIRTLSFTLLDNPAFPERVTIAIGVGSDTVGLETTVTNIQTTISSRAL